MQSMHHYCRHANLRVGLRLTVHLLLQQMRFRWLTADMAPAEMAPAEMVPTEVAPAQIAPAEVVPAEVLRR
jgi:hypothetical protein